MPLQYDPRTSKILFDGQEVGEYTVDNGIARVKLDLTYECSLEEWVVPLSWFDYGLHKLQKYQPPRDGLNIRTQDSNVAEADDVQRSLNEKIVRRSGYIWTFHKTDVDPWPSTLHGRDYDKHLKLDAITGDLYDVGTRQKCGRLKDDALKAVQQELRNSKDFHDQVVAMIDSN
jgi:hypothetical protein